jgi:hypothetical protein
MVSKWDPSAALPQVAQSQMVWPSRAPVTEVDEQAASEEG